MKSVKAQKQLTAELFSCFCAFFGCYELKLINSKRVY